ncbi:PREDICTED: protein ARV1 isoform X2 [Rhagoletis zephyria]|uniref:protein ARV1 isoform X2 n=1 Tax=Rhagoletis zephyria TaxID=28612 RepID=UPI00081149ED|nr:PREDICTED: protein ARV1 isoform X2 [Rhagoletis zephyria]
MYFGNHKPLKMTKPSAQQQSSFSKQQKKYICINCGHPIAELYRKYTNTAIKTSHCEKCHKVADKYIEFDPIIILVDAMLLSQESYRHMLHNRNFKLNWKLSLVLLLLESFALWRQKGIVSLQKDVLQHEIISEKGFYICCLQNMIDYVIITLILLIVACVQRPALISCTGINKFAVILLKAITIANLSKMFLLPLIVWRENTTDLGANIHQLLVLGHHLLALVYIYAIVGSFKKLQAFLIILPAFVVKEYIKSNISVYLEYYF